MTSQVLEAEVLKDLKGVKIQSRSQKWSGCTSSTSLMWHVDEQVDAWPVRKICLYFIVLFDASVFATLCLSYWLQTNVFTNYFDNRYIFLVANLTVVTWYM